MHRRKLAELALADTVLTCSEYQKKLMVAEGLMSADRVKAVPLWTDVPYWTARARQPFSSNTMKLRVLYAGAVSLRKGVPYLLHAVRQMSNEVALTLVGGVSPEMHISPEGMPNCAHLSYVPKERLREIYGSHDVLVMPSLGDSFGFVALEAMACGLPVIVTDHCGVPVPDETWRVPAADAEAIASRLSLYLKHRALLAEHGRQAAAFAMQFTAERYRRGIQEIYRQLLGATSGAAS